MTVHTQMVPTGSRQKSKIQQSGKVQEKRRRKKYQEKAGTLTKHGAVIRGEIIFGFRLKEYF